MDSAFLDPVGGPISFVLQVSSITLCFLRSLICLKGVSLRSLGLLVCRIQEGSVDMLLQDLCTKLFAGKKEHQRDLASIGLKTVVAEVSGGQLAKTVVKRIVPHLIAGIKTQVWSLAHLILRYATRRGLK